MINWAEINRDEILIRLSNKEGRREPSDKLRSQIEKMIRVAIPHLEEHRAYNLFDRSDLPDKSYFASATKIGMSICSIGSALPKLTENYLNEGKLSDGVILDAIGSVAADHLADIVNEEINREAEDIGLVASMRYSPGYCDMGIEDQKIIFDRVDNVGVTLSPSSMMNPVKSVSFAINLGDKFVNRCKTCEKRDNCPDRR